MLTNRIPFYSILTIAVFSMLLLGCTRQHYRLKTDSEAYSLLSCAAADPRWKLDDYRIDIDPRSRMFDPNNPDCEPMPPDDSTAACKMCRVAGMKGSTHWKECGCTKHVENPCWRDYLLFNDRGALVLDKDGAVELALLNSPEYQSAMENLYLSALKVSQERFSFDTQFFAGDSLFYTASGRLRDNGTFLTNDVGLRAEKMFAGGGELLVGLANTITWTFNGQNSWQADSLLNVGFVQPLLRNAGRKVVLESLTQSERNFLAAVRQMVFFQQGFYTKIVTGSNEVSAPSSGDTVTIRASNTPTLQSGFYGLLAEQIRIQNQRQNIVRLEDNLERFKAIFEAGQTGDSYEVERTKQNLLNSQSALLQRVGSYRQNIETYLMSLGLPPDMQAEVDDPLMEQFQLTSKSMTDLENDLNVLLAAIRKKDEAIPDSFGDDLKNIVRKTESEINTLHHDLQILEKSVPARLESLRTLERQLADEIREGDRYDSSIFDSELFVQRVEKLRQIDVPKNIRRLRSAMRLIDLITTLDERPLRQKIREEDFDDEIIDSLYILGLASGSFKLEDGLIRTLHDPDASREHLRALRTEYRNNRNSENVSAEQELEGRSVAETMNESQRIVAELRRKDDYRDWIRQVLAAFQNEMVTLSIMQTRARLDAIVLESTTITPEDALQIAAENRLDWMNQKAKLVDTWRQIDLTANKLRSDLNLIVEGELGTVDKRGVRFDGDNGRIKVGFEWDSPLTRHSEMLNYRRSQIRYQAARRDYYTYVDSVNADLRNILRDIRVNMVDFEIKRNAILTATIRVDIMQLRMDQPPQRGGRIDTNTADQLIDALDGLMTSQNNFLNVWVAYQTQRMLLDLKMGTMQLDAKGRWVDPGTITKDRQGSPARYRSSYGNPYGGAFASDGGLKPSKTRKQGFHGHGKAERTSKASMRYATNHSYGKNSLGQDFEQKTPMKSLPIPAAPRLDRKNFDVLNDDPLYDGSRKTEPTALPATSPTPKLAPGAVSSENDSGQDTKPINESTVHPNAATTAPKTTDEADISNPPRRSALSTDTIPNRVSERNRPSIPKPLKTFNAPPPPRTPE